VYKRAPYAYSYTLRKYRARRSYLVRVRGGPP